MDMNNTYATAYAHPGTLVEYGNGYVFGITNVAGGVDVWVADFDDAKQRWLVGPWGGYYESSFRHLSTLKQRIIEVETACSVKNSKVLKPDYTNA